MSDFTLLNPVHGAAVMQPLSWIIVIGIQAAFCLGFTMGANDVANSFGSSVGAGILTLKQACIVASIFDVMGSLTLGGGVSSTIATKIIDVNIYHDEPGLYMLGMLCASVGACSCVAIATRLGLPISTTHAVIGAVVGFSFVETDKGIIWLDGKAGLGAVFLSWIVSPVFSGIFAAAVFLLTRKFVLRHGDTNIELAIARQRKLGAGVTGFVGALVVVFVAYDLTESGTHYDYLNVVMSFTAFIVIGLTSYFLIFPLLVKRLGVRKADFSLGDGLLSTPDERIPIKTGFEDKTDDSATFDAAVVEDAMQDVEIFHVELERRFMPLCVMTACFMAFTHGANDIANAAGPFVAVWDVYNAGAVRDKVDVPVWILIICCVGVVTGLLMWGAYVITTVGEKITKLTPVRAYSIELGTATSVLLASFLRMPVSSTHCFIGAVISVGLCDGKGKNAVKWNMVKKILISWVVTVPLAGAVSAAFYAALKTTTRGVTMQNLNYTLVFYPVDLLNNSLN
eukprot:m.15270 g.15270  ORF g.15270 m.15270 type:complete len:510 (-) comp10504_c0_seq1:286-1815(-)